MDDSKCNISVTVCDYQHVGVLVLMSVTARAMIAWCGVECLGASHLG